MLIVDCGQGGGGFECISVKKENLTKIFFTEYEKNFKTFVKNDIC